MVNKTSEFLKRPVITPGVFVFMLFRKVYPDIKSVHLEQFFQIQFRIQVINLKKAGLYIRVSG
ncbi:hypothetical protein DN068_08705 [Taibaiella soli]|uniref:Uncharacterized protein n=1 Tax=Taibaiella soli TaxID=1649169 RepID=A0A2W2AYZ9_9BACT|nr:hypothetical protein DN068_08705 [Taibaiella soli]